MKPKKNIFIIEPLIDMLYMLDLIDDDELDNVYRRAYEIMGED